MVREVNVLYIDHEKLEKLLVQIFGFIMSLLFIFVSHLLTYLISS